MMMVMMMIDVEEGFDAIKKNAFGRERMEGTHAIAYPPRFHEPFAASFGALCY